MKSSHFLIIIAASVFMTVSAVAQEKTSAGTKFKKLNLFGTDKYTIEAEIVNSTDMKYTLKKDDSDNGKVTFVSRLNLPSDFYLQFESALQELDANYKTNIFVLSKLSGTDLSQRISEEAKSAYSFYIGANVTANSRINEPDAGTIRIMREMIAKPYSEIETYKSAAKDEFSEMYYWSSAKDRYLLYEQVVDDASEFPDKYTKTAPFTRIYKAAAANESVYPKEFKSKRTGRFEMRKILFDEDARKARDLAEKPVNELCEVAKKIESANGDIASDEEAIKIATKNLDAANEILTKSKSNIQTEIGNVKGIIDVTLSGLVFDFEGPNSFVNEFSNQRGYSQGLRTPVLDFNANFTREKIIRDLSLAGTVPDSSIINGVDRAIAGKKPTAADLANSSMLAKIDGRKKAVDAVKIELTNSRTALTNLRNNLSKIDTDKPPVNEVDITAFAASIPKTVADAVKVLNDAVKLLNDAGANVTLAARVSEQSSAVLLKHKNAKATLESVLMNSVKAMERNISVQSFKISVSEVQMEFNEGFIKHIVVFGQLQSQIACPNTNISVGRTRPIKFVNVGPIAFSTGTDYDDVVRTQLYSIGVKDLELVIELSDVIEFYKEKLEVDRLDFSPGDQTKTVIFNETNSKAEFQDIVLKKVATQKLFEAKVYTDFLGLTDESNPNGIIQTELERRFNLRTSRDGWGIGWIENWTLGGGISKMDKNNKSLALGYTDNFVAGEYRPIKFASTLGLRQHELINVGADLNLFTWEVPYIKSVFKIESGFRIGLSSVADSLRYVNEDNDIVTRDSPKSYPVSTFRLYPKVTWEVFQDERVSVTTSYSHTAFLALTNKFQQVGNADDFALNGLKQRNRTNQYNMLQVLLTFKPQGKLEDKLFFRTSLFTQQDYFKTTFVQFQFGYSFFISQHLNSD